MEKKSYLSDYLTKSIINSKVYSLSEKNLDLSEFENSNIIINSFYSSLKLEKIDDYELFIKKSIFELSKLLNKIKKKKSISLFILVVHQYIIQLMKIFLKMREIEKSMQH